MRLNKHFDSVLFQKSQNPLKKLLLFVSLFQQFKAVCSARKRTGSSHWLEKQPLGGGSKDSVQHDCLCNSMQT